MSIDPSDRAGPLRCPAELCSILMGVAFSWADMASCLAMDLLSVLL